MFCWSALKKTKEIQLTDFIYSPKYSGVHRNSQEKHKPNSTLTRTDQEQLKHRVY